MILNLLTTLLSILLMRPLLAEELTPATADLQDSAIEVAPQVQIPVQLRDKSQPKLLNERVYLRDVFVCEGLQSICAEVGGVDLGKSPEPGQQTQIVAAKVLEILKQEFPNYLFIHKGQEQYSIKGEFIVIDSDMVQSQLQSYLESQFTADSNLRAKVTSVRLNRDLKVRPGKFSLRFPDIYINGEVAIERIFREFVGNTLLDVVYVPEDNPESSYHFRAQTRILIERYSPVAIKALPKGKALHVNDFQFQWLAFKRNHAQFLQKIEPYEGWVLLQSLDAGEPISIRKIDKPRLIDRGDIIDVEIARGRMRLSTKAKALESGGKDDFINVRYLNTHKDLRAKVLGKNKVEVSL